MRLKRLLVAIAVLLLLSLVHQGQPEARGKKSAAARVKAGHRKSMAKKKARQELAQSKSKPKPGLFQRVVQKLMPKNTVAAQIQAAEQAKPTSLKPFSSKITRYIRGSNSQTGKSHSPEVRAELTILLGYKPVDTYQYELLSASRRNGSLFTVREYTPNRKLRSEHEFTIVGQEILQAHKPYIPSN